MMADWRGSSLQIVIAIIGSSLLVTGVTSLASLINKPLIEISVLVEHSPKVNDEEHVENDTTYRISVTNKGNSPANDVRLTMTYPGVRLMNVTAVLENENLTLSNERSNSAAFTLPRLSNGVEIRVDNNVTGNVNDYDMNPIMDFSSANESYFYNHDQSSDEPFSITVTYDQGSKTYQPPGFGLETSSNILLNIYFNIEVLKFFIPIVLALLLFGIAFRQKRKSISRYASNLLKDIETVGRHLKNDDSPAILFSSKDHSDDSEELKVRILKNYDYYDLIDDFYTGLKERDSEISKVYLSNNKEDIKRVLNEQNKRCFNLARSAHSDIDWKKFYKLDLILLIPAVVMGSFIISLICEGLPLYLYGAIGQSEYNDFNLYLFAAFIARTLGAFLILRLVMQTIQGSAITKKVGGSLFSRPITFFAYCAAIMGLPSVFILGFFIDSSYDYLILIIIIVVDIARMMILILVVSRYRWIRKQVAFLKSIK